MKYELQSLKSCCVIRLSSACGHLFMDAEEHAITLNPVGYSSGFWVSESEWKQNSLSKI